MGLEKPKRPLTAYNIFFREQRRQIIAHESRGSVSFAGLARTVAARWKRINPADHKICVQLAVQDKLRYQKEMKEWSRSQPQSEPKTLHNEVENGPSAKRGVRSDQHVNDLSSGDHGCAVSWRTSTASYPEKNLTAQNPSGRLATCRFPTACSATRPVDPRSLQQTTTAPAMSGTIGQRQLDPSEAPFRNSSMREHPEGLMDNDLFSRTFMPSVTQTKSFSWRQEYNHGGGAVLGPDIVQSTRPMLNRGLFDEIWLEPDGSFDLDGDTGRLFHRMLDNTDGTPPTFTTNFFEV